MYRRITPRLLMSTCIAAALGMAVLAALPSTGQTMLVNLEAMDMTAVLAKIKASNERFTDVNVALAEGYIPDPTGMCVTAEMEGYPRDDGNMGIHYFRPDLLGITATQPRVNGTGTHTDYLNPGVLIYEPQADGSLELVAVENLVFEKSWKAAGNEGPPSFAGHEWYHMVDDPSTEVDEAHGFEPHYELHAWVFRDNPNGPFAQFNPNATCEHHKGSTH